MNKKFHLVYKTTTTPFFPICLIGKCYSGRFTKVVDLNLKPKKVIVLIFRGAVNWFFDQSLKLSAKKIFNEVFLNPTILQKIKKKEEEISGKLFRELKTPVKKLFTDKNLNFNGEAKLKEIFNYYSDYGEFVDSPGFLFQVYLTEDFKNEVFQKIKGSEEKKNEIFNSLISSYRLTNYERFLFELSKNLGKWQRCRQIAKRFFWLIYDYLGEIINEKYIAKKIKEFQKDKAVFKMYLEGVQERLQKIADIKNDLPTDFLSKVNTVQEILYLYNERKKEVLNQVNIYLRKIMEYKLAPITISKIRNFYQLTPDEIINLLKGRKIQNVEKRSQRSGYLIEEKIFSRAPQKYFSLLALQKEVKVLKGIAASAGKVRGRINVILNISHIHKFKDGNILVAPFTNVNYLPIMSKAKAILTETGGLTSHAAIVSRELKRPCIVGIKGLFLVLKDGDFVEVDANKGIIKII